MSSDSDDEPIASLASKPKKPAVQDSSDDDAPLVNLAKKKSGDGGKK